MTWLATCLPDYPQLSTSFWCEIGRACRSSMPKKPTGPEPATIIVDRSEPVKLFALGAMLALLFEPELARRDGSLDDGRLWRVVKADLIRRYPNSRRLGRHSTPVEVILRMLVVKRLYNFS